MAVETKKPRHFFKNIPGLGKKVADLAGVQFVDQNAPTLGKVEATQVDFSNPQSLGDKSVDTLGSVPGVPVTAAESSVASVPPVPGVRPVDALSSVPPSPTVIPDVVQNAFANEPDHKLNPTFPSPTPESTTTTPQVFEVAQPTVVPVERSDVPSITPAEFQNVVPVEPIVTPEAPSTPTIPEPEPVEEVQNTVMPEVPATPEEPSVNNPEPDSEPQNTVLLAEPITPEEPLVNNPEPEPVIVSPSMASPEVVPSDHVVEEPEAKDEESTTGPQAFDNAFKDEPEDHLDPTSSTSDTSADSSNETQESEFDVKINPIADKLIKENPGKFIKINEKGDFVLDEEELDAAIFAQEVLEDPKVSTLFNKLKEKYGVTPQTAMYALKTLLK